MRHILYVPPLLNDYNSPTAMKFRDPQPFCLVPHRSSGYLL